MRAFDDAHAFLPLRFRDARVKGFHFRPMNLRPEMMLGVISVVEENPVINLAVAAYAPRDGLIGIGAVMAEVTVEITEAMSEVPKRQIEKDDVTPVQNEHDEKRRGESGQLDISPNQIGAAAFAKFFADGGGILTKNAEENVAPRILRFAIMPVSID